MDELRVPGLAAAHLAYHLRMALGFAAVGDTVESASETTLAWTLLAMHGRLDPGHVAEDLPSPAVGPAPEWAAVERRTEALALALQAHYVSEGQHAVAEVYETAAANVRGSIAALRT